ncbi:methyltransferase domain-containing protein [bacterium]|nr:methyltransferase domain-containing protein [bacterium]
MKIFTERGNDLQVENIELLRSMLQEYYGTRLNTSTDLTQKACCTDETQKRFADILELIPAEVKAKHYGCGSPVPEEDLTGLTVLDLGSGAGVDAFILSYLVGPSGRVYGIDMTDAQVEVAVRNTPTVTKRFGYSESNVHFNKDFIEVAKSIPDESIDLVISDCVINLSPLKHMVFQTIRRVLKEGGEFYVSDIAADRRVPEVIRNDSEMIAECLGGAEYEHDWFDIMKECGFADPRTVNRTEVQRDVMGEPIVFYSMTVRAFKFSEPLDPRCEDYGQIAAYKGTVPNQPSRFILDSHHVFEARRPVPVCRNTARMLSETRLAKHFEVSAPVKHFGLFACDTPAAVDGQKSTAKACC